MQGVNRADPCSSFMNDLCAQYPWVFGENYSSATVSVGDWSGKTVNAAVVYALFSPRKLLTAAMSADFVLSFRHVCIAFMKMTSGVEISPLWLSNDVIDYVFSPQESPRFLSTVSQKMVCNTLFQLDWKPWTAACHGRGRAGYCWCFMTTSVPVQTMACFWCSRGGHDMNLLIISKGRFGFYK